MAIGDGSCFGRDWKNEPSTGVQPKDDPDQMADHLRRLARILPAHADLLSRASSMLIKQSCKLALVRRAMK